jgi:protoporphyrinogen oxidase
MDIWKELVPNDFLERPRLSRIYYRGRFYSYPLRPFEALKNLGLITSAACMLSFAWAKAFPRKKPANFHEWVANRFGEKLFSIFFKTYTEKVWGMSCDEISADWAAQRIKDLDLKVALTHGLKRWAGATGPTVKTLIESFQYPRRGPGMMWEAAARKVEEQGGRVLKGRALRSLSWNEEQTRWSLEASTQDGGRERYSGRHVISSIAVRELVDRIVPAPPSRTSACALRYRDFLIVALILNKPDIFADNWIYIHDPAVKVGRIQNFGSWSPEMVQPGMSCLGLEYFCFEGDGLWNSSDAALIALAKKEIAQIGLIAESDVVDACVVRQAKAYPVYDGNYRDHVAAVRSDLEKAYPTLHLVGRNGMHKYNNQDHAMLTAMLTARNILAGKRIYDVWAVNEDAEYHEAGSAGMDETLRSERLVPRMRAASSQQTLDRATIR